MKVGELLKSGVIGERTIIEIEWREEPNSPYKRMAEGYADEDLIKRWQDETVKEFYWKSYPNVVTVYIAD